MKPKFMIPMILAVFLLAGCGAEAPVPAQTQPVTQPSIVETTAATQPVTMPQVIELYQEPPAPPVFSLLMTN